jgi:hypothetical protein
MAGETPKNITKKGAMVKDIKYLARSPDCKMPRRQAEKGKSTSVRYMLNPKSVIENLNLKF